MADVVFQYGADVKQILDALNQIDKTNEKVYQKAERAANKAIKGIIADHNRLLSLSGKLEKSLNSEAQAYDKIAQEADKAAKAGERVGAGSGGNISATQIGLVSGAVSALTTQFIQLGQQAISTLVDIGKQSVQTAIEFDTLKARLGGIFDGNQEAADQAFTFIQAKSKELGIDLSELAGAFIPKTENLQQFERVAKIATALARSDPEQGAIGARIALIEAMSGTFTSLQRRFEIPKGDIDRIKEAFDTKGMEGFVETLEQVLAESGKSFDDLANTAQTSFDKLSIAGQQLGGRLGVPIVASLEEASSKILSFLNENEDELIVFADTVGRAIADVIDFIASVDLSQLNPEQLTEFATYIFDVVNAVQLFLSQLADTGSAFLQVVDSVTPLSETLDYLAYIFSNLDKALVTASQLLALSEAGFKSIFAAIQPLVEILAPLSDAFGALQRNDIPGMISSLSNAKDALDETNGKLLDTDAAQKAARDSLLESSARINDYTKAVDGNKTKQDELRKSLEKQKDAGTGAADAIMAAGAAERKAAEDADKLKEAQDKVNKAMAEAEKDYQRKLEDIDTAFERKRLDISIEFAQKREDAAKKNLQKLSDLRRKNAQDIQDAETDLNRKEEDIARKFSEERIDLEREQRQKRVDIETSYRQKLEDIQSQFLIDAGEAEEKRDAIAFLRAMKQRDEAVQDAQTTRTREIDELRVTGEQRKEELRIQQERELEEARIANERKIEDLRLNLERQIEEQNIAYARELDDLKVQEERKFEEANRARERDIEDAKKAYDRKLEDLQTSLADELKVLQEGNAKLEEEQARHNAAMQSQVQAVEDAGGPWSQRSSTVTNRNNLERQQEARSNQQRREGRTPMLGGRASGGPVSANTPYLVGEKGPELFQPNTNGSIIPNRDLVTATQGASSIASYSSSRSQQINIPLATAGQLLDPIFIAQLRNIIGSEISKVM